jgi:phosphoribosylcarboxyaminoimidazole (NCAIR) mutase
VDNKKRLVSIAMHSEKDLDVMEETIVTLESFGIPYEEGSSNFCSPIS